MVQKRAQAKDYFDIDALLGAGITLPMALGAARAIYGKSFEPLMTVKALTYFGDGDLRTLPIEIQRRLTSAATEVDLAALPAFDRLGTT